MIAIGSLMPIDWRQRGKAARFDHGVPNRLLSFAPVAGVMLAAAMVSPNKPEPTHIITFDLPPLYHDINDILPETETRNDRIRIDREGRRYWNGVPIANAQLPGKIQATLNEPVAPGLILDPDDDAAYGEIVPVLGMIEDFGISKFCLGGLYRNRHYELPLGTRDGQIASDATLECNP